MLEWKDDKFAQETLIFVHGGRDFKLGMRRREISWAVKAGGKITFNERLRKEDTSAPAPLPASHVSPAKTWKPALKKSIWEGDNRRLPLQQQIDKQQEARKTES